MEKFHRAVEDKLQSYVYGLFDPRKKKNTPFYIGKGEGSRVFNHVKDAIKNQDKDKTDKLKYSTINKIISEGQKVQHLIFRHGLTEQEAFMLESVLISFIDLRKQVDLTNLVSGHESEKNNLTTKDINRLYGAERLEAGLMPGHEGKALAIYINQSYRRLKAENGGFIDPKGIYECTRRSWIVGSETIKNSLYAFAVVDSVIIDIYKINKSRDEYGWKRYPKDGPRNYSFTASPETDQKIRDYYLNKRIYKKKGFIGGWFKNILPFPK